MLLISSRSRVCNRLTKIDRRGEMARFHWATAASAAVLGLLSSGALAQSADEAAVANKSSSAATDEGDRDIIVTASKTGAQALQDVPLAIQVFSGEDLKERNITSVGDLVSSVPGAFEGFRQSN